MSYTEALSYYLGAFVDELTRLDVRDVVISPGSRSTPLALLLAEHENMRTYLHVDERSAAFFALGIAKAKKRPVALLCTSGTAAANYFPAITEAFHSRVPLLVLTADRPHELRDIGAPQAMNQMHLFGSFAKTYVEMALPEASETMYRYIRTTAARAVSVATTKPAGPVHLNFPLREPLLPDFSRTDLWIKGEREQVYTHVEQGEREIATSYALHLQERLTPYEKGIIVVGEQTDATLAADIVACAQALQYPVLADPLSLVRSGTHDMDYVIDCYDTFLRHEDAHMWKPDVIIRFGAMPVSKALTQFIQKQTALQIVVDDGESWRDPTLGVSEMVYANGRAFCHVLREVKRDQTNWITQWQQINAATKEQLREVETYEEMFEGKVFTELTALLPHDATLFVSNSMPIRDTDTFFFTNDKNIRVMANRGINGIDGIVSTALGVSVSAQPLVLVTGDLAFYHDLNGMLAAKLHKLDATIVVINNDGGGIFSFLPQYGEKKHFEMLFGTPLGLDYEQVVHMYGGKFSRPTSWQAFREELSTSFTQKGLHVIEIRTNRELNLQMHRALWQSISTKRAHENEM